MSTATATPVYSPSRTVIEQLASIRDEILPDGCTYSKRHLSGAIAEIEWLNNRIKELEPRLGATVNGAVA